MSDFNRTLHSLLNDDHLARTLKLEPVQLAELAADERWARESAGILEEIPIKVLDVVALAGDYLRRLGVSTGEQWAETVYTLAAHRLFPANFHDDAGRRMQSAVTFTLEMVGLFLEEERSRGELPPLFEFVPPREDQLAKSPNLSEYSRLLESWDALYIQEIMRLGREIYYFDLLSHIAGVHRVATSVGAQLYDAGQPVDMALISGAAMVHDIGKFGCRNEEEMRRMAYLHYYYTEEWCERHGLFDIGHIAMNHSTWDLELENLSMESLLLIYADFRVKAAGGPRGEHEVMNIYSLDDSFAVILNKLDNVDEAKRQRYRRVYEKLSDFEAYVVALGVDVTLGAKAAPPRRPPYLGMLDAVETPRIFKDLAFEHNIEIMSVLSNPDYLRSMLETLRASGRAVDIRANLNVFEEYITYMTRPQKELIASYLMEMLIHPEGDIRRQAARLIGSLIANFDERYSKWLPDNTVQVVRGTTAFQIWEDFLTRVFDPDHKIADRYRRFQGYAFQNTIAQLLTELRDEAEKVRFLQPLLRYYRDIQCDDLSAFILLDALGAIPPELVNEREVDVLLRFARAMSAREDVEIHLATLRFLEQFVAKVQLTDEQRQTLLVAIRSSVCLCSGEEYLLAHIEALLCGGQSQHPMVLPSEVFLENLKSSTPWLVKIVNIRRLADALIDNPQMNRLHVALHFSNLLKVSEQVAVRHDAGQMLVRIAPMLTPEEVNEVVVELHRGLEMDSFEFTKYIPTYLARLAMNLGPTELDEFMQTISSLLDAKNDTVAQLAIDTLAHSIAIYSEYRQVSSEDEGALRQRLAIMLGSLMKGLASYHESVQVETLNVLGQVIFGNSQLSLAYKREIFDIIYKRLLMLMINSNEDSRLIFYGHCAALNHIYRFLSEFLFQFEELPLYENKQVAFFPGTFDPFTLGHKAIVRMIRDLGFDVYLGLDEFSWSKNSQPPQIRRRILQMSLASEENVFIFPSVLPVNLANPEDLAELRRIFQGKSLFLVVGSDVVRGASAYKAPRSDDSVHTFNHLIVRRSNDGFTEADREQALQQIDGELRELNLPDQLERVSSTVIRKNIDRDLDISHLIDKMAQNYIYETNLYLGESKMKPVKNPDALEVIFMEAGEGSFWSDVESFLSSGRGSLDFLAEGLQSDSRLVVVRENGDVTALALVQIVSSLKLYDVFGDRKLANYLRQKGASRMAVISNLALRSGGEQSSQRALTSALIWAAEKTATYAIYVGQPEERERIGRLLKRQGFVDMEVDGDRWCSLVNMRIPIILADNVLTLIKEPYRSHPEVRKAAFEAHCRLQQALTRFHPGDLVLSYDALALEGDLAQLITRENHVPERQDGARMLGEAMCVPYGHLLRNVVVPHTVTRSLSCQRRYNSDMKSLKVDALPYHDSLESQARTLHSFGRPVILTDEVLNRGHTLELLMPLLKDAGVPVHSVACGIITGGGRDLLTAMDCPYHYIHYMPNVRYWLVDSKGYPFIDGYSRSDRPITMSVGLEAVINPVLPYSAPPIFQESRVDAAWQYSRVSLENALSIMRVLEHVYQKQSERNLTLNRLPEVLIRPMFPDTGSRLKYDHTQNASYYIGQDLIRLEYLHNIIPKEVRP